MHMPDFVARSVLANILAALCLTPAHGNAGRRGFVAAFGEVCIPERLSWHAGAGRRTGWEPSSPAKTRTDGFMPTPSAAC